MYRLKIRFAFIILILQVVTAKSSDNDDGSYSIEDDDDSEDFNDDSFDSDETSIEIDDGYGSKYKKTYFSINSNDDKSSRRKGSQPNDEDDKSPKGECSGGMVNCSARNNRPHGGHNRGNNNRRGGGNNNRQGGMNNRRNNRLHGRGNHKRKNDNKRSKGSGMQGSCNRCGIGFGEAGSGRVVNGRPVQPVYKYPWIVHLITNNVISCGGALVSATWVMTAAHCVFNSAMLQHPQCQKHGAAPFCYRDARMFKVGILSKDRRTASETIAVTQIVGHPKFYYPEMMHDISLMKLASPVQCSAYTMPVCLPKRDLHRLGQPLITAGYGWNTPEGQVGPQILREGSVREVDPRLCTRPNQPADFYNFIVCAAGRETGQSSCYGDSGSSVFGKFGNKFVAVGVVSYGSKPKCTGENPVAYHRVYTATDWIKRTVKDLPQS